MRWDSDLGLTAPTATGEMILLPRLWGLRPTTVSKDRVVLDGQGLTVAVLMSSTTLTLALGHVAEVVGAAA